jgi:hypothetical protein
MNEERDTDARLWHPWLRINRVLRVMLRTRWSAEAWAHVRVEFKRAVALRSEVRRGVNQLGFAAGRDGRASGLPRERPSRSENGRIKWTHQE